MFWVKTPHEPPRRAEEITPQKQQFASQKLCGSSAEDCVELVNRRSWRLPRAPQKLKLKGQNEGQCLFVCLLTQTGLSNLLTKQNDRRVQKCQVRKRESKTASALLIADSGFDGSTTAQFQAVLGSSINIVRRFDPLWIKLPVIVTSLNCLFSA